MEIVAIKCVWLDIRLHSKWLLVGTFYRPPNSDSTILTHIENSIDLARDTDISQIIILGHFNRDINKTSSCNKINSICQQYKLRRMITEQTHFTERSSSLIDIILVSNPSSSILSGVGDLFLNQEIRFHCSIFIVFKFLKLHKSQLKDIFGNTKTVTMKTKEKFRNSDWESLT